VFEDKPTRRCVLSSIGAGSVAALAGCADLTADDEPTETLRVGSQWGIESLDPMEGSTQLQRVGIFESLVSLDWDASVQPQLAESWETSSDGLVWTFTLREDIEFHDGEPFDAESMALSLERALEEGLSAVQIDSIEATAEHELEIATDEPFAPLLSHLTRRGAVAMSPATIENETIEEPVGTGPFKFESWRSEAGDITLTRNENYYDDGAHVPEIEYENVDSGETRELKLRNNEIDLATQLDPGAVPRLEEDDDTIVQSYETPRLRYCSFNLTEPPVDDVRVRQAFMYGINTQLIIDELLEGYGQPAAGLLPPLTGQWFNDGLEPYHHDPERARELLEEAGWEAIDDGSRERDGEPLEITLWTYDSRPELPPIAEVIQDNLAEVGFDTEVRNTDWGTMDDAKESGEASMTLESTTVFGDPSDPDRLEFFVHTEDGKPVGYENTEIDDLLADGQRELNDDHRKPIYDEIQTIAHEELPVAPLTYQENVIGLQQRAEEHEPHPTEYRFNFEDVQL